MNSENKTLIRERLADARAALQEALPLLEDPQLYEAVADFLVTGRAEAQAGLGNDLHHAVNSLLYRLELRAYKLLDFYIDGVRHFLRPHTSISSRPAP